LGAMSNIWDFPIHGLWFPVLPFIVAGQEKFVIVFREIDFEMRTEYNSVLSSIHT
jgi:hypothetical protein